MQPLHLNITDRDEEYSILPRWTLWLKNRYVAHYPSTCGITLEWSTRTDGKWGKRVMEIVEPFCTKLPRNNNPDTRFLP